MASHGVSQASVRPVDADTKAKRLAKHQKLWNSLVERRKSRNPYSIEALNETSEFLKDDAAFYTVWNYRREILLDLMKPPEERYQPPSEPEVAENAPTDGAKDAEHTTVQGAETQGNAATKDDAQSTSETPTSAAPNDKGPATTEAVTKETATKETATTPEIPPRPATPKPTDISALLKSELRFIVPLFAGQEKVYVLWHQRLWLLRQATERLPREVAAKFWQGEMELVHILLAEDARNFHGWMYRRLVVAEVERLAGGDMTKEEFNYTERLLRAGGEDENKKGRGIRNYSAWWRREGLMGKLPGDWQSKVDLLEDELELVKRAIVIDVNDQSLWLHYRWLVTSHCEKDNKAAVVADMEWGMRAGLLDEEIEWLQELREPYPECKYLLLALINHIRLMWKLRKEPHDPEDEGAEGEVDEERECREIWEWIQTLKRIDPMRRGRYNDLEIDIFPLGYSPISAK